jgi:hypothetical protein
VTGQTTGMRPRVALALAVAGLLCLVLAALPVQTSHRLVGLAGAVVFGLLFLAERNRPPLR